MNICFLLIVIFCFGLLDFELALGSSESLLACQASLQDDDVAMSESERVQILNEVTHLLQRQRDLSNSLGTSTAHSNFRQGNLSPLIQYAYQSLLPRMGPAKTMELFADAKNRLRTSDLLPSSTLAETPKGKSRAPKKPSLLFFPESHVDLNYGGGAIFSKSGKQVFLAAPSGFVFSVDPLRDLVLYASPAHRDAALNIVSSPDRRFFATSGVDPWIKIWKAQTGSLITSFEQPQVSSTPAMDWSADGRWILASASTDLNLWDLRLHQKAQHFKAYVGHIQTVKFSPHNELFAFGTFDGVAQIWNLQTRKFQLALLGHKGPINKVIFSPNSRSLLTASSDHSAKLWDTQTGALLLTLRGHTHRINDAVFTKDGEQIISVGSDGKIIFWNAKTGDPIHILSGIDPILEKVELSADNQKLLVSGRGDKPHVRLWDLYHPIEREIENL